jgi:hypothetical protein
MITFQLEDRDAQAMVAMLNASGSHASFMESLNEQLEAQTKPVATPAPVVEEVVEEVIEEVPAKKAKVKSE